MSKKTIALITALILSISIFTVTALAAGNNLEAYELLKDVFMTEHPNYDSGSFNYSFNVTDNNQVRLQSEGVIQMDSNENMYVSGILADDTLLKSFEISKVDQTMIFKDVENNLYYQVEEEDLAGSEENYRNHGREEWNQDRTMTVNEERLMDALVGDLKNKMSLTTLENENKRITLDLKQDDIPIAVNLMLAVAAEDNGFDNDERNDKHDIEAMKEVFPFLEGFDADQDYMKSLVSDISVLGASFSIIIDSENQILGMEAAFEIEGKDESGVYHVLGMNMSMNNMSDEDVQIKPIAVDGELIIIDEEKMSRFSDRD